VNLGETAQMAATGSYSNGTSKDITSSVTWTTSSSTLATVTNLGLVSSVGVGQVTVSASESGVSGSTTLTINPAALVSVTVTPNAPSLVLGATQQFAAMAVYSDKTTTDVTGLAIWNSASEGVATISASGLATTAGDGATNITASWNGVSGATPMDVVTTPVAATGLNGDYAFTYTSTDSRGPQQYAGTFHANPSDASGSGTIDSGTEDSNTSAGVANVSLSGSYNILPDGRGTLVLQPAGQAGISFHFILSAGATTGEFVEYDANATAAGAFELQDPNAFQNGGLTGNFVFRLTGIDTQNRTMGEVGFFSFDGAGNLTGGAVDGNDFGVAIPTTAVTGTYSITANGRGTLNVTAGSTQSVFTVYMVSSGKFNLIASDSVPALLGTGEQQTTQIFSNASLAGGFAYLLDRAPSSSQGRLDLGGRTVFDANGNITAGDQDEASGQNAITGGTYSVDSTGRAVISANSQAGSRSYIAYLLSPTRLYMLDSFSTSAGTGPGTAQSSSLTNALLSGTYGWATAAVGSDDTVQVLRLTYDGNGFVTGLVDFLANGITSSVYVNGTYAVTTNGRTTLIPNVGIGVQTTVFYVANGSEAFSIGAQPAVDGTMLIQ
jgi:hypothetical protein